MKKTLSAFALAFALLGGTSMAQAQAFDDWDADDDGALNETEFTEGFGAYSEWDEDGDGVLNEEEFETGVYDTWDDDDNGTIEEAEWEEEEDDWF